VDRTRQAVHPWYAENRLRRARLLASGIAEDEILQAFSSHPACLAFAEDRDGG
jgi:hypothetical protein